MIIILPTHLFKLNKELLQNIDVEEDFDKRHQNL